jgi:predicted nucleic acid-binding protein
VSGLVLDASSTLNWCFEDESESDTDQLIDRVAAAGALVPAIWPLEVANALVVAERRERITRAESDAFLALVEELPIAVDAGTAARAFHETMVLAREHGLSSYDAAYLELALRSQLPLATNDESLRQAAKLAGAL